MLMYILNIVLLIVYAAILLWIRPTDGKRKAFCVMAAGNWILLAGLRHYSVGADTYAYYYAFHNSKYNTWGELFENFRNTMFNWNLFTENAMYSGSETASVFDMLTGENALAVKDPGYAVLNKLIYTICPNYTVFLVFIAIVFMVPVAILIYRHSKEPLLSFIIYSSLFFSFFSLTGHRQTLATGIALSGFLLFAEKKKFVPFLLMILFAYPLHKSVITFVPIYFLQYIRMDRKKTIAVLFMFPIVFLLRGVIARLLVSVSGYDGYDQFVGGGAVNFTIIYVILMVVTLWKGQEAITNNPKANLALVAVSLAFLLTALTFVNTNLMRIVQYYSLFLILYIPDLIMAFEKDECVFAYCGAMALVLFLLFKDNPQYMFFWQ